MPRFAANLSLLYTEYAFLDRFAAAAQDGFSAVEFLFPYDHPATEIRKRLDANGLRQVLINTPAGGNDPVGVANAWAQGWRGTACLPGCEAQFRYGLELALSYASDLDCPRVHVMAGVMPAEGDKHTSLACYRANVCHAAQRAAQVGIDVLIEPINQRSMPGYFLHRQEQAHALRQEIGAANLKVQMDLFHCQIEEGDVATKLRRYLPTGAIGHMQIAGVPERHEPDTGELNYPYLFLLLDELGYTGWVGCEYHPQRGSVPGATTVGLRWMAPYL